MNTQTQENILDLIENVLVKPSVKSLIEAATAWLQASAKELEALTRDEEVHTALMIIDLDEAFAKQEQAKREAERQEQGQGMMRNPYGFCPKCGKPGVSRVRATNTDRCANDHYYQSNLAVLKFNNGEEEDVQS